MILKSLTKLLGGIDEGHDLDYLSLIVGDEQVISSNYKILPHGFTHLTRMGYTKTEKLQLLKKFDFTGNILVYCVKFGFSELRDTIEHAQSLRNHKISTKIIRSKVGYEVVLDIRKLFTNFVNSNRLSVDKIEFEVDNDQVRRYIQDGGLRHRNPDRIHKIADCVVHANGREWSFNNNVKELGDQFKNDFHTRVLKSLTRGKK